MAEEVATTTDTHAATRRCEEEEFDSSPPSPSPSPPATLHIPTSSLARAPQGSTASRGMPRRAAAISEGPQPPPQKIREEAPAADRARVVRGGGVVGVVVVVVSFAVPFAKNFAALAGGAAATAAAEVGRGSGSGRRSGSTGAGAGAGAQLGAALQQPPSRDAASDEATRSSVAATAFRSTEGILPSPSDRALLIDAVMPVQLVFVDGFIFVLVVVVLLVMTGSGSGIVVGGGGGAEEEGCCCCE